MPACFSVTSCVKGNSKLWVFHNEIFFNMKKYMQLVTFHNHGILPGNTLEITET
jgi:hypothetical protein